MAEHCVVELAGREAGQMTATVVTGPGRVTMTVADPDWAGVRVEVAVMVAMPPVGTVDGAVYTPVAEMLPALAVQVTAVEKAPVPITVEEQLRLWPVPMLVGVQVMATEVTVGGSRLTVAVPAWVGVWVEVAVMVAVEAAATVAGAV